MQHERSPEHTPSSVVLSPEAVRVLAHPLRSRLLTALRLDGPATATALAAVLGTNTGATSYHLRKLASVGLVTDAPGGTARERRWRAAHDMHAWFASLAGDDPDTRAAADWLTGESLRRFGELADAWQRDKADWSVAWQDAAGTSDYVLDLAPEQLRALSSEIHAVIERTMAAVPGDGHRRVFLYLHAVPDTNEPA